MDMGIVGRGVRGREKMTEEMTEEIFKDCCSKQQTIQKHYIVCQSEKS